MKSRGLRREIVRIRVDQTGENTVDVSVVRASAFEKRRECVTIFVSNRFGDLGEVVGEFHDCVCAVVQTSPKVERTLGNNVDDGLTTAQFRLKWAERGDRPSLENG